jgi:hypothetical protein
VDLAKLLTENSGASASNEEQSNLKKSILSSVPNSFFLHLTAKISPSNPIYQSGRRMFPMLSDTEIFIFQLAIWSISFFSKYDQTPTVAGRRTEEKKETA